MKGVEFKAYLQGRKDAEVLTEWHYRLTGSDGRLWDLFFRDSGRMKLGLRGSNDFCEDVSPERLLKKIGWDALPVKPADLTNNNFSDV